MTTKHRQAPPVDVTVQLRFLGAYSGITGRKQDELSMSEGATVGQLLNLLTARYGEAFERRVWTEKGTLRTDCKIFLDQDEVKLLDTPMCGNTVTLFFLTPVSGACLTAGDARAERQLDRGTS